MNTDNPDLERILAGGEVPMTDRLRSRVVAGVGDVTTSTQTHNLAQMNIAKFKAGYDDPIMADFVEMLDPINHMADADPGCLWRLTDEGANNAMSIAFYDDPLLLVNMSVWTDLDSLRNYVYRSDHAGMVKRRGEWAEKMDRTYTVLWWVPAGHTPDLAEGDARLQMLEERGPTPDAFTFARSFPPPTDD